MELVSCTTPSWFFGVDIGIQALFALVAILIAYMAYRVYRVSKQRSSLYFGMAFLGIAISFLLEATLNFCILTGVRTFHLTGSPSVAAVSAMQLSVLVTVTIMIVMIASMALLAYVTLKERGIKILLLLLALAYAGLMFSVDLSVAYFTIVSIFLLFITVQHYKHYMKCKNVNSLLVFVGFGLIFLGDIQLALANSLDVLYVSGLIVSLGGYLFLLASLVRVLKK